MPREICQCAEAVQSRPSPCVTCAVREDCLVHLAQRNLFEAPKPYVNIRHLVSSCSGYVEPGGASPKKLGPSRKRRRTLSILPSLAANGVTNLCRGCVDAAACDENQRLERIARAAKANGLKVTFTTFSCSTRDVPDLLLRIGTPA